MEVILLEKIPHVGDLGAKVKVKPGFARNYLLPKGKAQAATKLNLANFELRRAALEKAAEEHLAKDRARAQSMVGLVVTISANVGNEGRLFGSVGTQEIASAISETGHAVTRQEVKLPTGPIRQVGEYDIDLHLHGSEVVATVKVVIKEED